MAHDNRIWSNFRFDCYPQDYSSPDWYLMGDSAFTYSNIMVTPYKQAFGQTVLSIGQSWFYDVLNLPWSGIENTIGISKSWFPWLHNIEMRVRNQQSMVKIIKYFFYPTFQSSGSWVHTPPSGPVHMYWLVTGDWTSHCNHRVWWTPLADGKTVPRVL